MNIPQVVVKRSRPNASPKNPDALTVTVDCPHCGREHTHGAPDGRTRNPGPRVAHGCGGDYWIVWELES